MRTPLALIAGLTLGGCCSDADLGLRIYWDNGLEEPVRFGCGDARAVRPLGRDRTGYAERTGTQRVPLCWADDPTPFATALVDVLALPTCDPGRRLEVVLRLDSSPDGTWTVVLPEGADAALVRATLESPEGDTDLMDDTDA